VDAASFASLGATTYTFSLILAAFLLGLGAGSSAGAALARNVKNPRFALGVCQLLLTVTIGWAAYAMTSMLPYWPVSPGLALKPSYTFQIDLVRCLWSVLPAAVLWGASFPLALAAVGRDAKDPARLVGVTYAANTVGGIIGALFGSLLIIAWLGTQASQRILIGLAAISAIVALVPFASDAAEKGGRRFAEARVGIGGGGPCRSVDQVCSAGAAAARRLRALVRDAARQPE
jgi:spermidine synthase